CPGRRAGPARPSCPEGRAPACGEGAQGTGGGGVTRSTTGSFLLTSLGRQSLRTKQEKRARPFGILLMFFLTVVSREQVIAEVTARRPPHRVDVVAAALRVVVLDQQSRSLHAVVVPVPALRG